MEKLKFMLLVCGAALAMLTSGCGSAKEYLITSGSENLQGLTKITDETGKTVNSLGVSWDSPTVFLSLVNREPWSTNIYKKDNPTSSAMTQITSGDLWCAQPAYNPATDRMAFTYATRYDNSSWHKGDIYTLGFNNINALSPITQTATVEEYFPSFTPDGRTLCFQSKGGKEGEIWTKNLNTGELTLLGNGMQPQISPDGSKIVFTRYKGYEGSSPISIWVMNIDGTEVTEILSNANQKMGMPSWSPDGTKIVFQAANKRGSKYGTNNIFSVNADGTGLAQLTTNDSDDFYPRWSADGYIYFISNRGTRENNYQAWRFRAR